MRGGITLADLKADGAQPEVTEVLLMDDEGEQIRSDGLEDWRCDMDREDSRSSGCH